MWLLLLTYCCLLTFISGIVWRVYKYASLPVHLRWELYPVAHEIGRPYGGSYLEDEDWWHRPRKINLLGESTVFLREIVFFREYFYSNRRFWSFVYPFHLGLFLLLVWILMLVVGSILALNGSHISSTSPYFGIPLIYYLTLISGVAAFILGIFGTIGLLIKRSYDEDLRNYTAPIDYFNLTGILLVFLTGLLFWIIEDRSFDTARGFIQGLITFKPTAIGLLMTISIVLSCLLLAYMPFTRMMHYVAKYFTYHKVRWDDEPNKPGTGLEKKLQAQLDQTTHWSAPHIHTGQSWSEQVQSSGATDKTEK
ncbi:MAG: respiratory nitrate reductase subunit gamma [Dehalococcoidia bacterium]|jgi:nitrate reductase gamma subunit